MWEENSNGGYTDIFFRASNDNGQTFNTVSNMSDNDGDSHFPINVSLIKNTYYHTIRTTKIPFFTCAHSLVTN